MESTDQLGNLLKFDRVPKRIVSLVPSQSQFLWDLGLEHELIGITKFCIHPRDMYKKVKRVGGTKNPDIEKIKVLKPDLIIGNKEENERSVIERLSAEFPVWMSDVNTPEQALAMMSALAKLLDREKRGGQIVGMAKNALAESKGMFKGERVAYFIWNNPYHFAGSETFIHSLLTYVGFNNVFFNQVRYPEYSLNQLKVLNPRFCFLSSEPYPFKLHQAQIIQKAIPEAKIVFVDGEAFSWYGSRLIYLYEYLIKLKKELYA